MARVARVRRLVVGVVVATFVVPVAIVVAVEVATRAGHDELREHVAAAVGAIAAAPEPATALAAIAKREAVDAWLVDPAVERVVATTQAMPSESDLGLGLGVSSAGFGSLTGSAAMAKEAYTAARVEPWQREAVVRAREHGAAESCATVEPDALAGGLYGGDTLWSCEAARRRGDGLVVLVEASAPRAASKLVDVRGPLLVLAGIIVAVGALLTAWLVRRLARPLGQLHARVEAMTTVPRGEPVAVARTAPREIGEVATAVDALVARLDAARAEQAEGAADLAHALKGPLARIKVALADDDPAQEAVRAIDRIVVELLEIARAEAGLVGEAREVVDVRELVTNALAAWRSGETTLRGDPAALRCALAATAVARAVTELLDNARAFRRGGRIVVELCTTREGSVEIAVFDDGPGVDGAIADTLFQRFATRRPGGTGLGLAYVRAVGEAHGGTATYARASGETRFGLVLGPAIHI